MDDGLAVAFVRGHGSIDGIRRKEADVRKWCITATGLAVLTLGTVTDESVAQPALTEVIRIDADAPAGPFPHFWEQMFGSGRANLTLRESWRTDLRAAKAVTDFRYVRFHDILDDQNGVYSEGADGTPIYNWSYVDQIYDGLLANNVRPFVELSFMPRALAASQKPHPFWYKPLPNPPRSYEKWGRLIEHFTRHLEDRYGPDEVRQWYFEVWNEPNIDFWTGKPAQSTYFELYAAAAKAAQSRRSSVARGWPRHGPGGVGRGLHSALHPRGDSDRFCLHSRLRQ